jgi:small subunit ribosomal protein S8
MLTRTRNAVLARHDSVLMPASRMKVSIAKILKQEGFITDYEVIGAKASSSSSSAQVRRAQPALHHRPQAHQQAGLRVYVGRAKSRAFTAAWASPFCPLPAAFCQLSGLAAQSGGELVCYVWYKIFRT